MSKLIFALILCVFQINTIRSQEKEVLITAKLFCHSTNDFFYFKNDETLKSKTILNLSEIFDYKEGAFFVSTGIKTIILLPKQSMDKSLEDAALFFEKSGDYSFAVRGKSRSMMRDGKAIYRYYPYKNAIVFEIFQ